MGLNDTAEMLEVAKQEYARVEGERDRARATAARLEAELAEVGGDVIVERDALQARIDAALAVPHGPFGPWDDDLCEYEQVRAALVSEEPAPEPSFAERMAEQSARAAALKFGARPDGLPFNPATGAPEPPKLDPSPMLWPDGSRSEWPDDSAEFLYAEFSPRPEFEQDRAKYEVQS